MGDCYSVELRVKLRKSTKSNMQCMMRQWMRKQEARKDVQVDVNSGRLGVDWNLAEYRRNGIRPDSFTGICKILLAFHQKDCSHVKASDNGGFDLFVSGFNASYGWHSVMVEAFEKMSWALEEGSYIDIWYGNNSHDVYEIEINDEGEAEVWENHRHGS